MFHDSPNNLCFSGREPGKKTPRLFEPIWNFDPDSLNGGDVGMCESYLCDTCGAITEIDKMYSARVCLSCWKGEWKCKTALNGTPLQSSSSAANGSSSQKSGQSLPPATNSNATSQTVSDPTSRGWVKDTCFWKRKSFTMGQSIGDGWYALNHTTVGGPYLNRDGNFTTYDDRLRKHFYFPTWEEIDEKLFPSKEETEPSAAEGWKSIGFNQWTKDDCKVTAFKNLGGRPNLQWGAWYETCRPIPRHTDGWDTCPSWQLLKAAMKEMK